MKRYPRFGLVWEDILGLVWVGTISWVYFSLRDDILFFFKDILSLVRFGSERYLRFGLVWKDILGLVWFGKIS